MKTTGGWGIWAALAVCAVLVLGAMTWLTRNVLASEHDRSNAEARADLQERVRLALWRMDAAGTAVIVDESQRPVGDTTPLPADLPDSPVRMRFELSENGSLSARQGEGRLPELKRLLRETSEGRMVFTALCGSIELSNTTVEANLKEPVSQLPQKQADLAAPRDNSIPAQAWNNEKERAMRSRAVESQVSKVQSRGDYGNANSGGGQQVPIPIPVPIPPTVVGRVLLDAGPLRPSWIGGQLFLLRKVVWEGSAPRGGKSIEGIWLDPKTLGDSLLAEVRDLLPGAELAPATSATPDGMVLASFPFRLETGAKPMPAAVPRPIVISLAAGWAAVVLAILAASLLVRGILRLSERRASFVSAVTHELRTPLTTFRLYSDMLEAGAVKEEKRGDYLRVLSREADRLSHLVENVLAFSRIERGSARTAVRQITARELLEPMRERFASRLASVGMELDMLADGEAATQLLKVDTAAVEHILFNVVDNAAKYAGRGVLSVRVASLPHGVAIRITDQGPGIPISEHKRIFRAFHKSARDAAESRPGVGLGLALSRRLARSMGGDLTCDPGVPSGASFLLSLPS
ncbi:MAG: HAMP domain-containing sensor histidine kinase [Luteolibacter sp.]